MKAAASMDELAFAWSGFLTDAHDVFSMLRKATQAGASKQWSDALQRTRDDDELLRYVHQARHAHHHGLAEFVKKEGGNLSITAGDAPALIRKLVAVQGKGVSVEYSGARPVVTWTPDTAAHLLAVKIAGWCYLVPTQHLGQRLTDVKAHHCSPGSLRIFGKRYCGS